MKPPPICYYRPNSVPEVVDLLNQLGNESKLLAGGQSLLPLLNLRLVHPQALIDLNRIEGLSYIREEDSELVIGALTRQREAEFSDLLAQRLPILAQAITNVGHPAIRNRGTVGGSLAHADPAAELPCVITALGAKLVAVSTKGERTIDVDDFFSGFYSTALSEGELLKEVRIPLGRKPVGWDFLEFNQRYGDFALAEVAVLLFTNGDKNRLAEARVIVGGVGERPLPVKDAEQFLVQDDDFSRRGGPPAGLLKELERRAREELRASVVQVETGGYHEHLAAVLVRRCVTAALDRWKNP